MSSWQHSVRIVLAVSAAVLACALSASRAAAEEQTHLYNATLSLSGDCTVSEIDPVPDPGCPEATHPPEGPIVWPRGVTTDRYGDIYVVNGNVSQGNEKFHIDVFDPSGRYLTEVAQESARTIAVDSTGHLYVRVAGEASKKFVRFDPIKYSPQTKEIVYESSPIVLREHDPSSLWSGIAIDPSNDHLYIGDIGKNPEPPHEERAGIFEYGSAVNGLPNEQLNEFADNGDLHVGDSELALDASRHRIYAVDYNNFIGSSNRDYIQVFNTLPPYQLLAVIDGSTTPAGKFSTELGRLEPAVNEANGHLFVSDGAGRKKIYEFGEDGEYIGTLPKTPLTETDDASIAIDNGDKSPNRGYLFTPSGERAAGHFFAWEPKPEPKPPVVESLSFGNVTNEQAVLHAKVNPEGIATHYAFEYVTRQTFEESGFLGAKIIGEGELLPSTEAASVSASALGLSPGTTYEFRVLAGNECAPGGCSAEAHQSFSTYAPYPQTQECDNQALRIGASALLPDCRAFELVTPADTNGVRPYASVNVESTPDTWNMPTVTADGDNLAFAAEGSVLPGLEGNGTAIGDDYVSKRTGSGWLTEGVSPTGVQASSSYGGAFSADHGFQAVKMDGKGQGSLVIEGHDAAYIRYPDGSYHLAGQGTLATDFGSRVWYISPGGTHAVITSSVRLEPQAPESPTASAVYDRTLDGKLHVVSLLPGDIAPTTSFFAGASVDGSTIAFGVQGGAIYLRIGGALTLAAAPEGSESAGLSADGRYLFFMDGGDLYRFDAQTQETARVTETGDATPLDMAEQGTGAYFISHSALGEGANPNGQSPVVGGENVYYWDGQSIGFVATVTKRDVEGADAEGRKGFNYGLGRWLATPGQGINEQTSEVSPDGKSLIFESRAELTGYETGGSAEIYRYDASEGTLICVSCSRSLARPSSDARIRPAGEGRGKMVLGPFVYATNLSPDGKRVIFETAEQLVASDTDGVGDVYEWEADGKGSCAAVGGCVFLLSSGHSAHANEIFGVSESGDDVFISTSDLLLAADSDETPSIYDARVGGGFPSPPPSSGECLGEACQPAVSPLEDPTPASLSFEGRGNPPAPSASSHPPVGRPSSARCPKGKRLVKRAGKNRCVKKKVRGKEHRQGKRQAGRRAHR